MKIILYMALVLSLVACQKDEADQEENQSEEIVEFREDTELRENTSDEVETEPILKDFTYIRDTSILKARVNTLIDDWGLNESQVGLVYHNLDDGDRLDFNSDKVFLAGSTSKVPIVMYLFDKANEGLISLDQVLYVGEHQMEDGTGVIYYESGPGAAYSLYELAQLMIEYSDNTATNMIYGYLGSIDGSYLLDTLAWKYDISSTEGNYITPAEAARIVERIYLNEVENPLYDDLVGFMKDSIYKDYFTPNVKGMVYNKTGDFDGFFNDIGIVEGEDSTYIFSAYTEALYDPIGFLNELGALVDDWHNGPDESDRIK
mgnify:CR=1 FL=1